MSICFPYVFAAAGEKPEEIMKKQIIAFIDDLKSNKKLATFDEAATKQAVVLRLLSFLDWDIFNVEEVYPDYAANSSDLLKQKPDAYVPQLIDLLMKNRVARGQALKAAKTLFQKKKQKMAADFLPEAWNKIISEPNKIFVELLSENTEKLCGYKIDSKSVENFLGQHIDSWLIKASRSSRPTVGCHGVRNHGPGDKLISNNKVFFNLDKIPWIAESEIFNHFYDQNIKSSIICAIPWKPLSFFTTSKPPG